jgi:formate dehydrogenase major subunit
MEVRPKGWPVARQARNGDLLGLGPTSSTRRSDTLRPRTEQADRVAKSICPYCAVGCAQLVYVKNERIVDIEGDPDSFVSQGTLCPKGAATFQLVTGAHRHHEVLYRGPRSTQWERMALDEAMERVADRVKESRDRAWQATLPDGRRVSRCMNIAHLGGATLDNEENYLIKKLLTAGLGIVQVENQARV